MKPGVFHQIGALLKETGVSWWDDKAPRLAAALSYYTVFSIAPVLVLVIAVAGIFFGDAAVHGHLIEQLEGLLGHDGAALVQNLLAASSGKRSGVVATVVGFVVLLIGATTVMIELQDSLNVVWRVVPKANLGIRDILKDRLLSLGLILSFGFVLLVSLGMSAGLAALGRWMQNLIPGWVLVGSLLSELVSFALIALFIALIFKILPQARIAWRNVWIGAFLTSSLFHVGKLVIGLYLSQASVASTYGATGSLAALLVWVYYSSMIIILGAEFTRAYADRFGSGVRPDATSVPAPEPAQAPGAAPVGPAAREREAVRAEAGKEDEAEAALVNRPRE